MITILICFLSLNIMNILNPMKMVIFILFLSSLIMIEIGMETGSNWIPILYYLLFMGGILMTFMLLSSLTPNEYSKKLCFNNLSMIFLFFLYFCSNSMHESHIFYKLFVSSFMLMNLMVFMILFYFIMFIFLLNSGQISMRCTY